MSSMLRASPRFFFVVPLLLLPVALWLAGATSLSGQRTAGTVDCTMQRSHWLGLVSGNPSILTDVQEARLEAYACNKTETINGQRVNVGCERLQLVTATAAVNPELAKAVVDDFNTFLQSNDPTWARVEWQWGVSLALTGASVLFGYIGKWTWRLRTS